MFISGHFCFNTCSVKDQTGPEACNSGSPVIENWPQSFHTLLWSHYWIVDKNAKWEVWGCEMWTPRSRLCHTVITLIGIAPKKSRSENRSTRSPLCLLMAWDCFSQLGKSHCQQQSQQYNSLTKHLWNKTERITDTQGDYQSKRHSFCSGSCFTRTHCGKFL